MQYLGLLLAGAAAVSAQGVTSAITPTGSAPAGCTGSFDGNFEITVVKPQAKRSVEKRAACGGDGTLVIGLENGVLTDAKQRTGYIASNFQFQFDGPPQAGAIYTAGFSLCGNSSLALGPTTVFYQCLSGGFYNLYNKNWAAQCEPVAIDAIPCGDSGSLPSGGASTPAASAPASGASPATQSADGQPEASSAPAVSQITDGQPQASSAAPIPISQLTDGQPQMPTALVSQITDGQPQAATGVPVSQITDGQPQAPNATAVSPTITPAVGGAAYLSMPTAAVMAVAGVLGMAFL